MNDKCSKYEGLFIFSDDETLKKHLGECEDCRKEQEKMDKISELISEVKFHYYAKNKRKSALMKIACVLMLLIFSTTTIAVMQNYDDMMDTLKYGECLSAEDLGFPVDSYGLITVD